MRVIQRDEGPLPRIQALKAEHLFWGYRRIWADFCFVEQRLLNRKRMFRLMLSHQLLVQPSRRLKAA